MEFHVDSKIARFPAVGMLWIDAQSLFGTGQIEPVFNIGIVITQWWFGTLNANVVRIQARRLVGTRQAGIAHQERRLTGKFIQDGIAGIAFLNHAGTMRHDRFHGLVRGLVKNLNPMRIVHTHFGIIGILHLGIGQAIANGQASQVQVQQGRRIVVLCVVVLGKSLIALVNAMRNGRHVMTGIRFADNIQRRRLVLRIGLQQGLQKVVHIFGNHLFIGIRFGAIRKAHARWLIQPNDVGRFRPRIGIDRRAGAIGIHGAGSIFRQEGHGTGTARSARQPQNQGNLLLVILTANLLLMTLFKHPKKQVLVFAIGIVLGTLNVHVARHALARGIAQVIIAQLLMNGQAMTTTLFRGGRPRRKVKPHGCLCVVLVVLVVYRGRRGTLKDSGRQLGGLSGTDTFTGDGSGNTPDAGFVRGVIDRLGTRGGRTNVIARRRVGSHRRSRLHRGGSQKGRCHGRGHCRHCHPPGGTGHGQLHGRNRNNANSAWSARLVVWNHWTPRMQTQKRKGG